VKINKSVNVIGADSDKTFVDGDNKGSIFTVGKTNLDIEVKLAHMDLFRKVQANTESASITLVG
jgi:hypothetical protein